MKNDTLKTITLLMMTVLAIIILLVGSVFGISAWVQANWGANAVAGVWAVIGAAGALFAGWGLSLKTQRATLDAIIDFQEADDRGEVARARLLTEVVKGAWQGEQHAARHAPALPSPTPTTLQLPAQTADNWQRVQLTASSEGWAVIE